MFSVSCETVKAGVVQDEITENGSAQVVRFLLFVDTSNNSILGREKQVLTIHDPNSKQQFSAFHPISPQLPNYKIDKIVNNVPCSWLLADNVNHQATTVYVYISPLTYLATSARFSLLVRPCPKCPNIHKTQRKHKPCVNAV